MEKDQEMVDRGKNKEELNKIDEYLALQIATMKEENSHEVASINTKQDKINEKQNNMDDLRKKLEATEAEIANLEHQKSQEFIQMKKKQDVTFEMEKKHAQMENMKLFMKDVKVPTGFTLSAAGWPLVKWPYLGDYTLTSEERNGRPVYRHSHKYWPMFCQEDGTWAIEGWVTVGHTEVVYRSRDAAVIPALCQHWEHKEDQEFNSVDMTAKFF